MIPAEKILIVEDEVIVAMALRMELENSGYTVTGLAATGKNAVDLAEKIPPSLILMDIHLPGGMNGIETIRLIREKNNCPVIFLTGFRDETLLEQISAIKGSLHLNKPAGVKDIIRAMGQLKSLITD